MAKKFPSPFLAFAALLLFPLFGRAHTTAAPGLTLAEAMRKASDRSAAVAIRSAEAEVAQADANRAAAALKPRVDARVSGSAQPESATALSGQGARRATAGLAASIPVFDADRVHARAEAEIESREARGKKRSTALIMELEAARAFIDLLRAEADLKIGRNEAEAAAKLLAAAQKLHEGGRVDRSEVLRVLAEFERLDADLALKDSRAVAARLSLARLIGEDVAVGALVAPEFQPAFIRFADRDIGRDRWKNLFGPPQRSRLVAFAGREDPGLKSLAETARRLDDLAKRRQRMRHAPSLTLLGTVERELASSEKDSSFGIVLPRDVWSVEARVELPLWDGGLRRAELYRARARARGASLQLNDSISVANSRIAVSVDAIAATHAAAWAAQRAADATEQSRVLLRERFAAGGLPVSELISSETRAEAALRNAAALRYEHVERTVELQVLLGLSVDTSPDVRGHLFEAPSQP